MFSRRTNYTEAKNLVKRQLIYRNGGSIESFYIMLHLLTNTMTVNKFMKVDPLTTVNLA